MDISRPRPPADLVSVTGLSAGGTFVPAPELVDWIRQMYVSPEGLLHTEEHAHLDLAAIGCLWTTDENTRQGRRIVGQAEMPARSLARLGQWQRARSRQQLREWFGYVPDFLLTFDALHADESDDAAFCALVDHELYHCGQAVDEFGAPRFDKETGEPIFAIRGHDIEEFVGVVRRFGVRAAGQAATEFVIAAAQEPEIAPVRIAQACGTCALRAA